MKSTLFSDIKRFIKYIQKKSYVLQIITLVLFIGFAIYQVNINNIVLNQIKKAEKKVDFRYFNITRSLEDIHSVEINTRSGKITKSISKQ